MIARLIANRLIANRLAQTQPEYGWRKKESKPPPEIDLAQRAYKQLQDLGRSGRLNPVYLAFKDGTYDRTASFGSFLTDWYPDLPWDDVGHFRAVKWIVAQPDFPDVVRALQDHFAFDMKAELETDLKHITERTPNAATQDRPARPTGTGARVWIGNGNDCIYVTCYGNPADLNGPFATPLEAFEICQDAGVETVWVGYADAKEPIGPVIERFRNMTTEQQIAACHAPARP